VETADVTGLEGITRQGGERAEAVRLR